MQPHERSKCFAAPALRRDDQRALIGFAAIKYRWHAIRQIDCGRSGHQGSAGVHCH
jgi:hypothetical protein